MIKPRSTSQVYNIMPQSGIEIYMTAQLIHRLSSMCWWVGMKASLAAILNELQATRGGQPEDAATLGGIPWGHDDCNCFFHHDLHVQTITDCCLIKHADVADRKKNRDEQHVLS